MKNRKFLILLLITTAFAFSASGCFGGEDAAEQVIVEETPTPEPTQEPTPEPTIAPDVQDTTYTSSSGDVSIKLPDATWAAKSDEADMLSFESPEQGKILVLHGSGEEDMSSAVIPNTQDLAVALEQASDLEQGTDFEIQNYTANDVNGVGVYSYTVKYTDTTKSGGYAYAVKKVFANDSEYYSVTGSALDDASLANIQAAVESFQIVSDASTLRAASQTTTDGQTTDAEATGTDGQSTDGTGTDGTDSQSTSGTTGNSGGFTDEQLSDTNQTRTIYRNSDGHPLVITPDGNGNWVYSSGNTYRFVNDEDVYDQNDVDYYWHGEGADVYYMPVE